MSVKMASKQRRPQSASSIKRHGREVMRPIISSDVMGNRNVEVAPVGAWVEPADDDVQPDAVIAAQIEEEKIRRLKAEKENRLRSFQQQVKHRVSQANRLKRQQQIHEAEKAFELERKVVQQSCLAGDMPRKDTCMLRQDLDKAIRKRLLEKYGEDIFSWDREEPAEPLQSHTQENHQITDKARQQLVSKKIAQNGFEDEIPKKEWKVKATREIRVPTVTTVVDEGLPSTDSKIRHIHDENEDTDNDSDTGDKWKEKDLQKKRTESAGGSDVEQDDNDDEDDENDGEDFERKSKVQFSQRTASAPNKHKKRPRSRQRPNSGQLASILCRDSEGDILARQRRQQAAISRRIFMDREREAVRENIRRQEHRKKIKSLKKEKEEYRQELEDMAHRQSEPLDPVTGETSQERKLREKLEAMHIQEMVDRRKDEMRRAREMERYLDALRHSLIEKVTRQGIQLPSLCACGDNIWDTHPETCANNCFFYKNPRAYARALQSMLASAEVM